MKWFTVACLAAVTAVPGICSAQQSLPIGNLPYIADKSPSMFAMSGYEILNIKRNDGDKTPIMRTQTYDARLVEILSRTQAPQLRSSDIREMTNGNRHFVVVRKYLLVEVKPQDAAAEGTSINALTHKWAARAATVLPQIAPAPSRFGI